MNGMARIRLLQAVAVTLVLTATAVGRPSGNGLIRGTLSNSKGVPIANARILATCEASGQTFADRPLADGSFELSDLPTGVFMVAIEVIFFAYHF
jgi:hypothetical protein